LLAAEFEKEIKSPGRKHFYLVKGMEPIAVEACLRACREAVEPEERDFNFQSFQLKEVDVQTVIDCACSSSFFQSSKIILARTLESEKYTAEETAPFLSWIKNPASGSTIVLLYQAIPENVKLFKIARDSGMVVDCRAPDKYGVPAWIRGVFKDKGLNLTEEASRVLVERVGENLPTLVSEADKLALHPGPGRAITPKVIRDFVSLNSTGIYYELSEPVVTGDAGKALGILLDLLDTYSPFNLLGVLDSHFLRLMEVKINLEAAKSGAGAVPARILSERMGVRETYVTALQRQSVPWTLENLEKALSLLEDAHLRFVTSPLPNEIILQELTVRLLSLAGRGGRAF
jgi:DNA polymerase-3 subunit delta